MKSASEHADTEVYKMINIIFKYFKIIIKIIIILKLKSFNQQELNLHIIIDLNLDKIYTIKNLKNIITFKRALILLC